MKHLKLQDDFLEELKINTKKRIDTLEEELNPLYKLLKALENAKDKSEKPIKEKIRATPRGESQHNLKGITGIITNVVYAAEEPLNYKDICKVIADGALSAGKAMEVDELLYLEKRVSAILKQLFDRRYIDRTNHPIKGFIYTKVTE